MKFYRHLRSFVIFNIVMACLMVVGSGPSGIWKISFFWGIALGIHYLKVNGIPGTDGFLSEEWEEWMEERERRRTASDTPMEIGLPDQSDWRERDLV